MIAAASALSVLVGWVLLASGDADVGAAAAMSPPATNAEATSTPAIRFQDIIGCPTRTRSPGRSGTHPTCSPHPRLIGPSTHATPARRNYAQAESVATRLVLPGNVVLNNDPELA